jgi:hypothetical protein
MGLREKRERKRLITENSGLPRFAPLVARTSLRPKIESQISINRIYVAIFYLFDLVPARYAFLINVPATSLRPKIESQISINRIYVAIFYLFELVPARYAFLINVHAIM